METKYNYEDQSLLLAIKDGNEKAFDILFRKYYPMLCAYGNKFVELEDAEECVQDAPCCGFGKTKRWLLSNLH